MITAGIDGGARAIKVLILRDGKQLARSSALTGFDQQATVTQALESALQQAGVAREELQHITATGIGRKAISFADSEVTEMSADAKATVSLFPQARTVIDVGAEEGRAIRCEPDGRVKDFAVNEKCAAGAGTFVETMARTLEIKLEEAGALSLKAEKVIPMNAQCAVFAESEVVSLIHSGTAKEEIIRAVHEAMADRISAMARRVGIEREVALVGGVGRDAGFIKALAGKLGMELFVPMEPEFAGALGAALIAAERARAS
ncbi:MAG: CoA activase [Candidatus Fraserbacteria bacterium RBG_16_55_9]|uniref:CoA activase n=1 Tax=Fraserbacteria sp. (strain RBG_16_55_9) TaxID=1817864 RepID=A0A1F5UVB7_FRAXR|nr:MAG: CoA activase [Candidatus Fraserbacteria bacterium RBG_16_55_9]